MTDILIELDDEIIHLYEVKAELNGRSFNDEILAVLTKAAEIKAGDPPEPRRGP